MKRMDEPSESKDERNKAIFPSPKYLVNDSLWFNSSCAESVHV